ncbi:MAG: hypothetical protein JSV03_11555, partial [Planctomycetota bacterium]
QSREYRGIVLVWIPAKYAGAGVVAGLMSGHFLLSGQKLLSSIKAAPRLCIPKLISDFLR